MVDRDELNGNQQAVRVVFERFKGIRPSEEVIDSLAGPNIVRQEVRRLFDLVEDGELRKAESNSPIAIEC